MLSRAPADLMAGGRLSDDQSQAVFRCLLDSLARPGQPATLPTNAGPGLPPVLLPGLALADVDVTVTVLTEGDSDNPGDDWLDVLRTATGARAAPLADAQFVVALRPPRPAEIAVLKRGAADRPELGARLIVACNGFDGDVGTKLADPRGGDGARPLRSEAGPQPATRVGVQGPGVPDQDRWSVLIHGISPEVLEAVDAANRDYPAGIDTWLVTDARRVIGLPRSCRLLVAGGETEEED